MQINILDPIDYVAGNQQTLDLPVGDRVAAGYRLDLAGTIDVGQVTAGTTNGTVRPISPLFIFQDIFIEGLLKPEFGGVNKRVAHIFPALHDRLAYLFQGTEPDRTGLASGAVQNETAIAATIDLSFRRTWPHQHPLNRFFALDLRMFQTLTLVVNWLDVSTIAGNGVLIDGGDRSVNEGAVNLTLNVEEHLFDRSEVLDQYILPVWSLVRSDNPTTAPTSHSVAGDLPRGGRIAGIGHLVLDDGVEDSTHFRRWELRFNTTETGFYDTRSVALRTENEKQYNLETVPAGVFFHSFEDDGNPLTARDVRRLDRVQMLVTVGDAATTTNGPSVTYTQQLTYEDIQVNGRAGVLDTIAGLVSPPAPGPRAAPAQVAGGTRGF